MTTIMTEDVYVFLCSRETEQEVLSRMLVGTRLEDWDRDFSRLREGDAVLLYNFESFAVRGPYRVIKAGRLLVREAWGGKFPAQAFIQLAGREQRLPLDEILGIVPGGFLRSTSPMPRSRLTGSDAAALLEAFDFDARPTADMRSGHAPKAGAGKTAGTTAGSLSRIAREWKSQQVTPTFQRADTAPMQTTYRTPQGFVVRSKAERAIAEYFYREGVECHYERDVPGPGRFRCDFYVPSLDVYVEYWGKPDEPDYASRMREKQMQYREQGLRLIEIFPADEADLDAVLRRELQKFAPSQSSPSAPQKPPSAWDRFVHWIQRLLGLR